MIATQRKAKLTAIYICIQQKYHVLDTCNHGNIEESMQS